MIIRSISLLCMSWDHPHCNGTCEGKRSCECDCHDDYDGAAVAPI